MSGTSVKFGILFNSCLH